MVIGLSKSSVLPRPNQSVTRPTPSAWTLTWLLSEIFAWSVAGSFRGFQLGGGSLHLTPAQLKALKAAQPAMFEHFLHAFNHALHIVFVSAVPFAALGIIVALLLKETPLRRTTGRGPGMDAAGSQAMPESAETAEEAAAVTAAGSPATAH